MTEYEQALSKFLFLLEEREKEYTANNFPNLKPKKFSVNRGRKFDKIIKYNDHSQSVYAFIKKENGAILKPASYNAPDPKQYERGNIFNDNPLEGTDEYSVKYMK